MTRIRVSQFQTRPGGIDLARTSTHRRVKQTSAHYSLLFIDAYKRRVEVCHIFLQNAPLEKKISQKQTTFRLHNRALGNKLPGVHCHQILTSNSNHVEHLGKQTHSSSIHNLVRYRLPLSVLTLYYGTPRPPYNQLKFVLQLCKVWFQR